jgi:hypothetical protein
VNVEIAPIEGEAKRHAMDLAIRRQGIESQNTLAGNEGLLLFREFTHHAYHSLTGDLDSDIKSGL